MNQLLSFIGFFLYLSVMPFIAPLLALLYLILGVLVATRFCLNGLRAIRLRLRPARQSKPGYAFPIKREGLEGLFIREHLIKNLSSNS